MHYKSLLITALLIISQFGWLQCGDDDNVDTSHQKRARNDEYRGHKSNKKHKSSRRYHLRRASHRDRPLKLRIAQVASLEESVPPIGYGGAERIVYYLVEELERRGHEVTLFASSDSVHTSATELVSHPIWPSRRANPWKHHTGHSYPTIWQMEQVRRRADQFDILHFHSFHHLNIVHAFQDRSLITLHGELTHTDLPALFDVFKDVPLVSISNNQRTHLIGQFVPNFATTIYHGIPEDLYPFTEKPQGEPYLAFLGRITRIKHPDWAIQIALKSGIKLKIAAKVDYDNEMDNAFWLKEVKPLIDANPGRVEFIGEINDQQKGSFLSNAVALLFPIDWPEPFGMVMIESMACGTPVIARPVGSVTEVVEPGLTGQLFKTIDEGAEAVQQALHMDRNAVRKQFEARWTSKIMADNYLKLYDRLIRNSEAPKVFEKVVDGSDRN